jgi:hypothetical protein
MDLTRNERGVNNHTGRPNQDTETGRHDNRLVYHFDTPITTLSEIVNDALSSQHAQRVGVNTNDLMRAPNIPGQNGNSGQLARMEEGLIASEPPQGAVTAHVISVDRLRELINQYGEEVILRHDSAGGLRTANSMPELYSGVGVDASEEQSINSVERASFAPTEVGAHSGPDSQSFMARSTSAIMSLSSRLSSVWHENAATHERSIIQEPTILEEADSLVFGELTEYDQLNDLEQGGEHEAIAPASDASHNLSNFSRFDEEVVQPSGLNINANTNSNSNANTGAGIRTLDERRNRARPSVQWSHAEIISLTGSRENLIALLSDANGHYARLSQRDIETGHGREIAQSAQYGSSAHLSLMEENRLDLAVDTESLPFRGEFMSRRRQPLSVPLAFRPSVRTFLEGNPDTALSTWIKRLSSLAMLKFTPAKNDTLCERIANIINFYNAHHADVKTSLQNIASASISDCRDGDLGGLIEIEKYLDDTRLISYAKQSVLTPLLLYQQAKKHFALECFKERAYALASALGSTQEVIEIQLLLMMHLGDRLGSLVTIDAMQNPDYASQQFRPAMLALYNFDCGTQESLTRPMDFLAQNLQVKINDKNQVLHFMAAWQPALEFIDQSFDKSRRSLLEQKRDTLFEKLETVVTLTGKDKLEAGDQQALGEVLSLLAEHQDAIPVSLYKQISDATERLAQLVKVNEQLSKALQDAFKNLPHSVERSVYLETLRSLYSDFDLT